ncbi:DUF2341 domain-containing protein [Candidatus Pacearchaeota archaeon]|nr:DUF2341 domain-containing protein [Candidatus Pacearchaeota archaeon]MBD3283603.1 DUF2341 domain-containing protein [Candidatus Pacearchaeota archaeon]
MNKKSMAKIGASGIFVILLAVFIFLLFIGYTDADIIEKNNYVLGEKIKFDLSEFGSYEMKIITPSTSFLRLGGQDFFVFEPEEIGEYIVELENRNRGKTVIFDFVVSEKQQNQQENIVQGKAEINKPVKWIQKINNTEKEYFTEAPKKEEKIISNNKKEVKVSSPPDLHYKDVLAYTSVEEILKLDEKNLIKIYWKEEDRYLNFEVFDENKNGFIDKIQWIVPHLSEQTFEIIIITKAEHLDSNRNFIENVYNEVKKKDEIWKEIPEDHYVRVVFEEELTNNNDITIYAKANNGRVKVYEKDSDVLVADFGIISSENWYKVYLTNLTGEQDVFDLRAIGNISFDYIVDPVFPENYSNWTYRKNITVSSSKITEDLENFPLLISVTDSNLSDYAQSDAGDIVFTDVNGTKLSHEIEFYNSTNGELVAWIKTNLSSSEDTVIWMYYNNSEVSNQENSNDVWSNGYAGVWHLSETTGGTGAIKDSTGINNGSGSSGLTFGGSGQVGKSLEFGGTSGDVVQISNHASLNPEEITISLWLKNLNTWGSNEGVIDKGDNSNRQYWIFTKENGQMNADYDTSGSETDLDISGLSQSEWFHLDYVLIEDSNFSVYVDGAYHSKQDITGSLVAGDDDLYFGRIADYGNWNGLMDEIRISNTPRSGAWINASYQNMYDPSSFYTYGGEQEQVFLTVDIVYPEERSYNYNITELNYTITNETALDKCWWTNNSGKTNHTITCGENLTGMNSSEGSNEWRVYINDTDGNEDFDLVIFTIDKINPLLTIVSPLNKSYNLTSMDFNISGHENLSNCVFSFNNFQNNYTMTEFNDSYFNYTNSSMNEGSFTADFWCNDSAGNINNTEEIVFLIDRTYPLIEYGENTENNHANVTNNWIYVNITVEEDNEANISFRLYDESHSLLNESIFYNNQRTINWTDLDDGSYYYNVTVMDGAGNFNFTPTRKINLDSDEPVLNIIFPKNRTYGYNMSEMNYTVSDSNLESCWWTNNSGKTNNTVTCGQNITDIFASDGDHEWIIYANDSFGNTGSDVIYFHVDTNIPEIFIYFPKNKTYNYNVDVMNFSASDDDLDSCWWTNNSGKTNNTVECNQNITGMNSSEGSNKWIIYANDSSGNIGYEDVIFNIDTTPPLLDIVSPLNQSYNPYTMDFNISGHENLDFCVFSFNNFQNNYTMTEFNDSYFNYTNSSMNEGSFTADFWCNDSFGNINNTEQVVFEVSFPQINIDVLYPVNNITVGHYDWFNVSLNISCLKSDCGNINITLDPENWLDDEWEYRKNHTIEGSSAGAQTNYVIHFIVHNGTGADSGENIYCNGKCKSDFGDIRFTSDDGVTELDYFLEEYNSGENASFWVEIDSIPASPGSKDIFVYYGNPSASTTSNGSDTFLYFEGFETGNKLTSGTGSITREAGGVTGSYQADVDGDTDYAVVYDSSSDFSRQGYFYEAQVKYLTSDTIPVGIHFVGQNTGEDGYQMIIDDRDGGSTPSLRKDTGYGSAVTGSYSVGTDNWVFFRAYADSSNFYGIVYENSFTGSSVESVQFSDSEYSSGSVGAFAYQDGGGKIDNLRVRKRASPEPSHGAWQDEEDYAPEKNIVNTTIGAEPFYTNVSNPYNLSLSKDESQVVVFWVNATFSRGNYDFFAYANLTNNMSIFNITEKWNVTIDGVSPVIQRIGINNSYGCNTGSLRINCTVVDEVSNISSVIIRALKPSGQDDYDAQLLSGDTYYSDVSLDEVGSWSFMCIANDSFNNKANSTSSSIEVYSEFPDLVVYSSGIIFSSNNPIENQDIIINATIYNEACGDANNFLTGFYDGDPDDDGEQINGNQTASVSGLSNTSVNITWNAEIGSFNFFVSVDVNNSVGEYNESNNKANKSLNVTSWQEFYGNISADTVLSDSSFSNISLWFNESNFQGNVFIADKENNVDWSSLHAIGRNTSDDGVSDDFDNIDNILNMDGFEDSVSSVFTNHVEKNILVHQRFIENIPTVNSTENSNFITGILWDSSDDIGDGEFSEDDREDLVFIAVLNKSLQGKYGVYDYEIKIPVRLREYNTTDTSDVYFYYDLT